MKKIEAN